MTLRIDRAAMADLVAHARADAPDECCGLLIGDGSGIRRVCRARNALASPTRYLIDPRDHFAAIRTARAAGLEVIGAYHSHPASAPVPSPRDRAEAVGSDFVYVIVSLVGPETPQVRAYRMKSEGFEEVTLTAVPLQAANESRVRADEVAG